MSHVDMIEIANDNWKFDAFYYGLVLSTFLARNVEIDKNIEYNIRIHI